MKWTTFLTATVSLNNLPRLRCPKLMWCDNLQLKKYNRIIENVHGGKDGLGPPSISSQTP